MPSCKLLAFTTLLLSAVLTSTTQADFLTRFSGCASLNHYYTNNAASRVGAYGLNGRPFFFKRRFRGAPVPQSAPEAPAGPTSTDDAPTAGEDFSETNVQVDGVDEPDIIKTDGKRVFVLRGQNFHVVRVTKTGAAGIRTGSLKLPTYGREMLFEGNYILVIGTSFDSITPFARGRIVRPIGRPTIVVYQIQVVGDKPRLVSTLKMTGSYVSSREVAGTARIVMTYDPTPNFVFIYPRTGVSEAAAKKRNLEIIRSTKAPDWLPTYTVSTTRCAKGACTTTNSQGRLASCSRSYRPFTVFGGFKSLIVVTVKVAGNIKPRNSVAIAADGQTVYSTKDTLYVATTDYRGDFDLSPFLPRWGASFATSLHKFGLSNKSARYVGSGTVKGSVLNQFSMHEYKGVFFVATTEGSPWWGSRDLSKSRVTSFATQKAKRRLREIGMVGNLGLGERIYSVRYLADTAYVVTFRQVDPLYIVDLSKPRALKVTGELKIPGFSSYLHVVGPGRVLGVGQEATLEGRTTGAKVSLFDVSNKRNPRELSSWTMKGSYTSAQWDHRAFLYWGPESVAVMPISVFSSERRFTGSVVLKISPNGIRERGRISHKPCCGSTFTPGIERNLVLGKVHLWSLSSQQLQVNAITDLSVEGRVDLSPKE